MRLLLARDLRDEASRIVEAERTRLSRLVEGELSLSGAMSVEGMLTRGDVDLHLRVSVHAFEEAVSAVSEVYEPVLAAIWTPSLATFGIAEHALPTGVAVTAIGSEHDVLFRRTWRRLAADPSLVARFNAIKARHARAGEAAYERAKADFFARFATDDRVG
jgi:GrpB-like predicted nucleotidyltransferase (UPF0157 family)